MSRILLVIAFVGAVEGVGRSIEERVTVGECADASANPSSLFRADWQIGQLPSEPVVLHETNVHSADLISIQYFSNFKVVTEKMAKEQYVLWQCGTPRPSETEVNAVAALGANYTRKYFTIPLQKVMAESSVHLSLLAALGVRDRVMHLTKYAVEPCWQKTLGCGANMVDTYEGGSAEDLAAQRDSVEGVFMDCNWDGDCSGINSRTNAIHVSMSFDPGPLRSAEHIKFMAAFFNKEQAANEQFSSTLHKYSDAATSASSKPLVAWISYTAPSQWAAESYVISMATYKLNYVTAAGGQNLDKARIMESLANKVSETSSVAGSEFTLATSSFDGSKAQTSAALFKALAQVDVIIDETYAVDPSSYTYESFLQNMNLESSDSLKFIANNMVLRIDGTHGPPPANALEWYESRITHPDWAVEGLARTLHGDASKRNKYFRNVAKGEMPEVLTASMCTNYALPQCVANTYPQEIPMMVAPTTTTKPTTTVVDNQDVSAGSSLFLSFPLMVIVSHSAWSAWS